MSKICYLDVDGVLYSLPKNVKDTGEIRPFIVEFVKTILDLKYEIRLLTLNPNGGRSLLESVLRCANMGTYESQLTSIPICFGNEVYRNNLPNYIGKVNYIDLESNYIWIQDGILPAEKEIVGDNYLEVADPYNRYELLKTMEILKRRVL